MLLLLIGPGCSALSRLCAICGSLPLAATYAATMLHLQMLCSTVCVPHTALCCTAWLVWCRFMVGVFLSSRYLYLLTAPGIHADVSVRDAVTAVRCDVSHAALLCVYKYTAPIMQARRKRHPTPAYKAGHARICVHCLWRRCCVCALHSSTAPGTSWLTRSCAGCGLSVESLTAANRSQSLSEAVVRLLSVLL
jgi:hypothetical protein